MNEFFDKEEWANRKQQDRESAYAMVDDALKKVGTDGKAFQTYLDVQSKFERYSVSNALLVAAQKPDATDLGEANFWRGRGGYIRKGESGILLMEPGNSYTRKDGSKGVGINVKRVFDISQTTLSPVPECCPHYRRTSRGLSARDRPVERCRCFHQSGKAETGCFRGHRHWGLCRAYRGRSLRLHAQESTGK